MVPSIISPATLINKNKITADFGIAFLDLIDHNDAEKIKKNPQNPNISKNSAEIMSLY